MTNVVAIPGGGGDVPEPQWDAIFTDELLQARAREVWRLTTQEMREAGTLSPVNAMQVERYVMASVIYGDAAAKVAENGALLVGRTKKLSYNLWFAIMKDADTMASGHEDKLGLSPRRRGSVTPAKKRAKRASAADGYLGQAQN